jgi:predicted YcjX-like family ATPase
MNETCTWITVRDGKVGRIRQTRAQGAPGPEWRQVPNDWNGSPGDSLSWFDEAGRRLPDEQLVAEGKRQDKRGVWFHKQNIGETKIIDTLDEEPGGEWTAEKPLENEPYQRWDPAGEQFIVDGERKEQAEKEQRIAKKKADIADAERRVQRSSLARQRGIATTEDEQFFTALNDEIDSLRDELRELLEENHA